MADKSKFMREDGTLDEDKLWGAYSNLETKLGSQGSTPSAPRQLSINDLQPYLQEASQNQGKLSDASYKNLQDTYGFGKDLVDSYVGGEMAKMEVFHSQLRESVGGKEAFDDLLEWTRKNVDQAEREVISRQLSTGSIDEAKAAISGLQARRQVQSTSPTSGTVQGTVPSTPSGGVQGYANNGEVVAAMSDERYETDSEYRDQVHQRIALTDTIDARSLNGA